MLQRHAHTLELQTPDGAALVPANRAAVSRMKQIVTSAYSDEASVLAANTDAARRRMERRLRAQLGVMAKKIMIKLSEEPNPSITPDMMLHLERALGGDEVASLCSKLMLDCPITSVGNAQLGDVLAGFSKQAPQDTSRAQNQWGGSADTDWGHVRQVAEQERQLLQQQVRLC